jgi:hypothetical protein
MPRYWEKLKHNEAFKLMKYVNNVDGYVEWIWNSRDGITPFTISDLRADAPRVPPRPATETVYRDASSAPLVLTPDVIERAAREAAVGQRSYMTHDDWYEDVLIPNYIPPIGSRIFTDDPNFIGNPGAHNVRVVIVSDKIHAHFQDMARNNPWVPPQRTRFA